MQPIYLDKKGLARFKGNAIVRYMLDRNIINMNDIALLPFKKEDRMQFAQLIGYSVDGYATLSYASKKSIAEADLKAEELQNKDSVT